MEGKIKNCCTGVLDHICDQADCVQDTSKAHLLIAALSSDERLTQEERAELKKLPDFCAGCIATAVDTTATSVISIARQVLSVQEEFTKRKG